MTPPATQATLDALRRGDLAGARELRLPGLSVFPDEIFGLADTLELLDIGGGALDALPHDVARLRRLRVLFCSGNRFEVLPPVLGDCPALSQIGCRGAGVRHVPEEALPQTLRWLTLTDNAIERLPAALGARPLLQKVMLAGNRLVDLPHELAGAPNLELLRLSANRFERLPSWLAALPRLAWLSFAGNPCGPALSATRDMTVSWSDLVFGDLLGEGASGRVHQAFWGRENRSVAFKLFKGAMTSDGLPSCERAACLAAGTHPNVMGALGRLVGAPGDGDGLVMPLLPAQWRALAKPPSLESCSRDVYDPALRLRPVTALRLARAVAAATAHLHARDILHGDLYAHNILWDGDDGNAVLSDFGAASGLPCGPDGAAFRRIESRAFGILLGELLAHCETNCPEMRAIETACLATDPAARPAMSDIPGLLARIA